MVALAGVEKYQAQFDATTPMAGRKAAWERFTKKGFPSLRAEAWKYTNVAAIQNGGFSAVAANALAVPAQPDWATHRLVFVNGAFDSAASSIGDLPAGVLLSPPAQPDQARYNSVVVTYESPFYDLNTALASDGFELVIPEGTKLEGIVEVLFLTSGDGAQAMTHSGIYLGKGASATIVERHLGQGSYFTNTALEIEVADEASLTHYRLQNDDKTAFHVSNAHITLAEKSLYNQVSLNLGAKLARNEIRCALNGPFGDLHLIGTQLVGGEQHLDTTSFIDHAVEDTTSEELYKTVLAGKGEGVFQGKIEVKEDAQRIVGNQMSRALMLSPDARMDIKPELEIYADDVQCSHGATVGDLDEDAQFYMQARGISKTAARKLLVSAFIQEVIDRVEHDGVREEFAAVAEDWLAGV